MRLPKPTIDILMGQVFRFDTFFVTSQEPYEGGVLFKGNLRGQPAKSYKKIKTKMENKLGDQYKLFLLNNPKDDKHVVVVVPRWSLEPKTTNVPELFVASSFGLVALFTLFLRNVPALQSDLFVFAWFMTLVIKQSNHVSRVIGRFRLLTFMMLISYVTSLECKFYCRCVRFFWIKLCSLLLFVM